MAIIGNIPYFQTNPVGKTERVKLFNIPQHRSSHFESIMHQVNIGGQNVLSTPLHPIIQCVSKLKRTIRSMSGRCNNWSTLGESDLAPIHGGSWAMPCHAASFVKYIMWEEQHPPAPDASFVARARWSRDLLKRKAARELIGPAWPARAHRAWIVNEDVVSHGIPKIQWLVSSFSERKKKLEVYPPHLSGIESRLKDSHIALNPSPELDGSPKNWKPEASKSWKHGLSQNSLPKHQKSSKQNTKNRHCYRHCSILFLLERPCGWVKKTFSNTQPSYLTEFPECVTN